MVGGLVRSALMELPVPPPVSSAADDAPTHAINGDPDPWRIYSTLFGALISCHSRYPVLKKTRGVVDFK